MNLLDIWVHGEGTVEDYVQSTLQTLNTTVAQLSAAGLGDRLYVYGFDEAAESNDTKHTLRKVFGSIKEAFPQVRTMATLNWPEMPSASSWPLDIWVDEYDDYGNSDSFAVPTEKELARRRWLRGKPGAEFWWYWWCVPTRFDRGCRLAN